MLINGFILTAIPVQDLFVALAVAKKKTTWNNIQCISQFHMLPSHWGPRGIWPKFLPRAEGRAFDLIPYCKLISVIYDIHIFSVHKYMFSIQLCGTFNDWDLENGGKSKLYYNKGSQGKPGARHLTKDMPRMPGSLTHFKPARGSMWIILKWTDLLESIDLYLYCHYSINMVSLIFSNVAVDLMKSWDQLSSKTLVLTCFRYLSSLVSESTQIKLFEVAKAHVCRF